MAHTLIECSQVDMLVVVWRFWLITPPIIHCYRPHWQPCLDEKIIDLFCSTIRAVPDLSEWECANGSCIVTLSCECWWTSSANAASIRVVEYLRETCRMGRVHFDIPNGWRSFGNSLQILWTHILYYLHNRVLFFLDIFLRLTFFTLFGCLIFSSNFITWFLLFLL